VIFQVEVLKDGKLKAAQLQLAPSLESQAMPLQLPVPATAAAVGGIATADGGCSPQEVGQLKGFVTTYDAVHGTGILQAPGVADALRFEGFGLELAPGQLVCFILHWFPDGTAEARGVTPVAMLPQGNEPLNGANGAVPTGDVKPFQELPGFGLINFPNQVQDLNFQGEVTAAGSKRSAAAVLDPTQLLAGAPPLKQQRWDVSEALPGMTAMEALPGMTAMEALPGMAAGATQADPQQLLSGTLEQATARLGGAVKSFNMAKGFGFIACQGLATDIFFLRSELPGGLAAGHAEPGQLVSFDLQATPDGRYRAARISFE